MTENWEIYSCIIIFSRKFGYFKWGWGEHYVPYKYLREKWLKWEVSQNSYCIYNDTGNGGCSNNSKRPTSRDVPRTIRLSWSASTPSLLTYTEDSLWTRDSQVINRSNIKYFHIIMMVLSGHWFFFIKFLDYLHPSNFCMSWHSRYPNNIYLLIS